MFKFYREGSDRREESVIGHDRFCQHRNFVIPRYRRRRPNRPTQAEIDMAFEMSQMQNKSSRVPVSDAESSTVSNSNSMFCRSTSELHSSKGNEISSSRQHDEFKSQNATNHSVSSNRGIHLYGSMSSGEKLSSGWMSISRFFSSVAASLSCRHARKTSIKYDPSQGESNCSFQYDYTRLGELENTVDSSIIELQEVFTMHTPGIIKLEKVAGHNICMKYLESTKGRYVLIDHLPDIGWRTNRLWYLVSDSRVQADRVLTITPCNPRSPIIINSVSAGPIIQACQALQHPYVCPILDLEVIDAEAFGKQFIIAVTPATRGSLRDVYHRSMWTDHWNKKYCFERSGHGVTEVQAQRFSAQILEALLELRLKGLPLGIGLHLHPGNILLQYGTARFSALDNILFGHQPRRRPFLTKKLNGDLEALDSIAFGYMLFSLCSGYEPTTSELSPANWNDIKDFTQVYEVLEFILKNPNDRFPTLQEISQLDFYRTLDLRELRAPPPPSLVSGPPTSSIQILMQFLEANRARKGRKSKSIIGVCGILRTNSEANSEIVKFPRTRPLVQRSYSSSTPSIPQICDKNDSGVSEKLDGIASSKTSRTISETSHSQSLDIDTGSIVSIYCTPPSSLATVVNSPSTDIEKSIAN